MQYTVWADTALVGKTLYFYVKNIKTNASSSIRRILAIVHFSMQRSSEVTAQLSSAVRRVSWTGEFTNTGFGVFFVVPDSFFTFTDSFSNKLPPRL